MYIPTRLRVLRSRYGISLRMLAACMHISNQQLSRMELPYIPPILKRSAPFLAVPAIRTVLPNT